jgi:hypothetical protein
VLVGAEYTGERLLGALHVYETCPSTYGQDLGAFLGLALARQEGLGKRPLFLFFTLRSTKQEQQTIGTLGLWAQRHRNQLAGLISRYRRWAASQGNSFFSVSSLLRNKIS